MAQLSASQTGSVYRASAPLVGTGCDTGEAYWPESPLLAFTLRMASHGLSVSRSMMRHDRRYALEQLGQAHALADQDLRELAMELFRHFERRQSGLSGLD